MKEASKKKEEIQSYSQELTDKEEQISRLSEKIAEQEREMAKLREELDSHHRTSEQLSAEQMREDDEREQQLLTLILSAMNLQLKLRKTKDKKTRDKMNLEGAKKTVEKYETMLVSLKLYFVCIMDQNVIVLVSVHTIHIQQYKLYTQTIYAHKINTHGHTHTTVCAVIAIIECHKYFY